MREIGKSLTFEYVNGHSKEFRETPVFQPHSRLINLLPIPKKRRPLAVLSDETVDDFAREQFIGVSKSWLGQFGVASSEGFHHRCGIIEESSR